MIRCQGCAAELMDIGSVELTVARGRFLGWRIFDGESAAGTPLKACWCPSCVDKDRPRAPKPPPNLEGQLTFDIAEETSDEKRA